MTLSETVDDQAGQTVVVIGFGRRLVAYLIDIVIVWILQFIGGICAGAAILAATAAGGDETAYNALTGCVALVIAAGYFVLFWATTGQTPGKMALGIKVIGTDGMPVNWGKAILRYIGYIISSLVLMLGFIWIAFDGKRQGWHDKIASTYVVRKETQFSTAEPVAFVPSDPGSSPIWFVLLAIVVILTPICTIGILLLLGPVIGNVFSNIVESL